MRSFKEGETLATSLTFDTANSPLAAWEGGRRDGERPDGRGHVSPLDTYSRAPLSYVTYIEATNRRERERQGFSSILPLACGRERTLFGLGKSELVILNRGPVTFAKKVYRGRQINASREIEGN